MSGQPLGSAMFLWTATLIGIEAMNSRLLWRDYWQDWLIASIWISFCLLGGFYFARLSSGGGSVLIVLPQIAWSILLFPAIVRLCAVVDRCRLPLWQSRTASAAWEEKLRTPASHSHSSPAHCCMAPHRGAWPCSSPAARQAAASRTQNII